MSRNDTEHLLSSPRNSERLLRSIRQFYNDALNEGVKPDEQELLDKLK